MDIKITKFEDLIKLIENYKLDSNQIQELLMRILGIFESDLPSDKNELIAKLRDYWAKYGEQDERPLFL